MLKRFTALLICLSLTLGLAACGSEDSSSSVPESSAVTVQENTAEVSMSVPNSARKKCESFFSSNADALGITVPQVDEDGSLVFICKDDKDTVLRHAKSILSETLDSVKSKYKYIDRIECDRDYNTVTILADRVAYEAPSGDFFKTLYIPMIACLALSGASDAEIDDRVVEFDFLDKDSLSVIARFEYPSDGESSDVWIAEESSDSSGDETADSYSDDGYSSEDYETDEYTVDNYSDDYSDDYYGDYYTDDGYDYNTEY